MNISSGLAVTRDCGAALRIFKKYACIPIPGLGGHSLFFVCSPPVSWAGIGISGVFSFILMPCGVMRRSCAEWLKSAAPAVDAGAVSLGGMQISGAPW